MTKATVSCVRTFMCANPIKRDPASYVSLMGIYLQQLSLGPAPAYNSLYDVYHMKRIIRRRRILSRKMGMYNV